MMSQHKIKSTTITYSTRPVFLLTLLFLFLLLPFPSNQTQTDKHPRNKRQTFDFSMNTPAPTETDVSNSSGDPNLPGSDVGGLGGGGGLGGLLGGLSGSSGSGTNSTEDEETSSNGGSSGSDNSNDCGSLGSIQCLFYDCQNGGECFYLNDSDCTSKCRCPPPYNDLERYDENCGRKNDNDNSASDPETYPCLLPCDHGECRFTNEDRTGMYCDCNEGYEGVFCNILAPSCPLPCDNGECRFTNEDRTGMYCNCTEGYVGDFCQTPCSRNCSNEGVCHLDTTQGREVCVCPSPWVGAYCTELPPDETPDTAWVYWLVGSLAVGLALVIIVAALVIYCLWKKRLVFAMKIVYYFKSYEDNDGLLYDAFVSYVSRPKDEEFVHKHLRPKLEQEMGFKLCLHQRDFIIGETITNNICGTLENSRRFILVLTPQYLESEWAEFEYQKAFHEMLKLKMRIVPIILEEITSTCTINPTLKAILESVTYITYPGCEATQHQLDKFWKRVHLSMPKIKSKEGTETLRYCADEDKVVVSRVAENGKVSGTPAYVKYRPSGGGTAGNSLAGNGMICSIDECSEVKETETLKSTEEEMAQDRHAERTKVFGSDEGKELNVTLESMNAEIGNGNVAVSEDGSLKSTDRNTLTESHVAETPGKALERKDGDLAGEEAAPVECTDPCSHARVMLLSPPSLSDSGMGSYTEDDSPGLAEHDTSDTSSGTEDDPVTCVDKLTHGPVPSEILVTRL